MASRSRWRIPLPKRARRTCVGCTTRVSLRMMRRVVLAMATVRPHGRPRQGRSYSIDFPPRQPTGRWLHRGRGTARPVRCRRANTPCTPHAGRSAEAASHVRRCALARTRAREGCGGRRQAFEQHVPSAAMRRAAYPSGFKPCITSIDMWVRNMLAARTVLMHGTAPSSSTAAAAALCSVRCRPLRASCSPLARPPPHTPPRAAVLSRAASGASDTASEVCGRPVAPTLTRAAWPASRLANAQALLTAPAATPSRKRVTRASTHRVHRRVAPLRRCTHTPRDTRVVLTQSVGWCWRQGQGAARVLSQMGVDSSTAADWLDESESVSCEPSAPTLQLSPLACPHITPHGR